MTDAEKREKVIRGLRQCVGYEDVDNKYTCIYDGDTNPNCPYGGTGDNGVSCMTKMMRDALALLKAQEPGKVNITNSASDGWKEGNCPFCGMKLDSFYNWSFCGTCGRAVKWE